MKILNWERRGNGKWMLCCGLSSTKEEKTQTKVTISGDRLNYLGEASTPATSATAGKMVTNSKISTRMQDKYTMYIIQPITPMIFENKKK
eukprot:12636456-Ditylum_brightwellii.AAC.1